MVPADKLNIQIYENGEDLERLRPEWEELVNEFPHSSTFCAWEWLVPWWRAFGRQDRLLLVAARDAAAELLGLAPLTLNRHRSLGGELRVLRLLGDRSQDSDNLDFPVHPDW